MTKSTGKGRGRWGPRPPSTTPNYWQRRFIEAHIKLTKHGVPPMTKQMAAELDRFSSNNISSMYARLTKMGIFICANGRRVLKENA
jgi:hypothetical protein